ncbi:MAG: hypothetical protein NC221_04385 [Duncaniella sp.]|nr:hypothetical protein [Muribaculum sp.]MCM1255337.1 hypothetical protein [Duncaniella sp.]
MKGIDNNNYSFWVDKFLNGETTCREEKELYAYFSQPVLPKDAEPYREMFGWYSSLQATSQATTSANADIPTESKDETSRVRILHLRPWQWISVAATVAILLTVGFIFQPSREYVSEEYMAYQGSYIIRDGKKITDLNIVVPEILRTEQMLNERVSDMDRSFEEMNNAVMNAVSSDLDMSNPAVREAVETALEF